jgi:peptidoglycan/xylan/chitin deacetylase (PgdA/CDA1 family)
VPITTFRQVCSWVKRNYKVIKLSEINSHFEKSDKPAAVISFDDGHYDIKENALPVLKELGLPFNINIDTEILETRKPQDFVRVYDILNNSNIGSYVNAKYMDKPILIDRANPYTTERAFGELLANVTTAQKREITEDLAKAAGIDDSAFSKMLSVKDLEDLSNEDIEFGSHTHTHSILTKINSDQVESELVHSKTILERITQKKINILAYPNGISNKKIENTALESGYDILLDVDNEINQIDPTNLNTVRSYKRINQYHKTFPEVLAHIFGVQKSIKKLKG